MHRGIPGRWRCLLIAALCIGRFPARAEEPPCAADLPAWLYDQARWAPPGYHVLCMAPDAAGPPTSPAAAAGVAARRGTKARRIWFWNQGHADREPARWVFNGTGGVPALRQEIQERARMRKQRRWRHLPWALLDALGAPVLQERQLHGLLFAFEGGRWVWPGVRQGFERQVPLADGGGNLTLRTLTLDPLAFTIEDFLGAAVARHVVHRARPRLAPAQIAATDHGRGAAPQEARTCSEAWLAPAGDTRLEALAARAAALSRVPRRLQVDFRVMQYKKGQQFVAHTDYYEASDFQQQPEMKKELAHGRNWLVTMYVYLSTVEAGGETYFPSSYGRPMPQDLASCQGPSVVPRRGRALLFYSLHPDGRPNLSSMHGGCKVRKGVKYTVNIWTFNQAKDEAKERVDAESASVKDPSAGPLGASARVARAAPLAARSEDPSAGPLGAEVARAAPRATPGAAARAARSEAEDEV